MGDPKYECETVKNVILSKEKRGEDASYERELLRAWARYREYKTSATKALRACGKQPRKNKAKDNFRVAIDEVPLFEEMRRKNGKNERNRHK